jgi:ABC-type branched-subunit amino acid transport system substrate-binding protein
MKLPLLLLFSLFLSACKPAADTSDVAGVSDDAILIGSSSALSGHASVLGTQYTLGSQAWFNKINAGGGIHGRRIEFLTLDDAYEPAKTVANTQRLIFEERVFMLFDYVGTPTSVQIIEDVHEQDIPAFGFFTGAESLRTPYRSKMFHVRASYYSEVEGAISYFVDHLGFERIAIMYQDDAFGLAVLAGLQLSMRKRNLEIIAADTFTRGTMELERPVDTISKSSAQAVILVGTYSPLAKFIAEVHETGLHPYFHTVSFVGSEAFGSAILEQGVDQSYLPQIIVTQVVPSPVSEDLETVVEYREHLQESFPDAIPNYVSLEGYINAQVLAHILQKAGPDLTREKLIETIESISQLDIGIGKPLTYGQFDHSGLDDIYHSRLSPDGHFKVFNFDNQHAQGR